MKMLCSLSVLSKCSWFPSAFSVRDKPPTYRHFWVCSVLSICLQSASHTLNSLYEMHRKKAGFPFTELQLVVNNLTECKSCIMQSAVIIARLTQLHYCTHWAVVLNWTAPGLKNEGELSHLQSRCFFLGAITSCVVALQTARATSDPVSWYCAAAMRSVRVCPDIFSR